MAWTKYEACPALLFCHKQCFGSGFFSGTESNFYTESGSGSAEYPDPWKKRPKTVSTSRNYFNFIPVFSTLNTVLFGQVTSKPNQKHHLNPIGLLMDGSGSKTLVISQELPKPQCFTFPAPATLHESQVPSLLKILWILIPCILIRIQASIWIRIRAFHTITLSI